MSHDKQCQGNYCQTNLGQWIPTVKEYIKSLNYGEVHLTIHDGRVVQVEKTEKVRF